MRAYATACCCNIIKCEDALPSTDDDSAMEVGGELEGRRGGERVKTLVLLAVDILVTGDFENRSSRSVKVRPLFSILLNRPNSILMKIKHNYDLCKIINMYAACSFLLLVYLSLVRVRC